MVVRLGRKIPPAPLALQHTSSAGMKAVYRGSQPLVLRALLPRPMPYYITSLTFAVNVSVKSKDMEDRPAKYLGTATECR